MILYFSATGNCEYVANKIAETIGDKAVSITEISETIKLNKGESLGIVTPTYFWGIPTVVKKFLTEIKFENAENSYIFYIATYGTTTGQADYYINRLLKSKGLKLSASFGIKTVDNWTVWFDATNQEEIDKTLEEETVQTEEIIKSIRGKSEAFIKKDKKPLLMCGVARLLYGSARKTAHLNVNEKCVSCGLCAEKCPVKAIEMAEGKPKWTKKKCTMCLRCLHRCPVFAINYDDKTQNNGQYVHPKK